MRGMGSASRAKKTLGGGGGGGCRPGPPAAAKTAVGVSLRGTPRVPASRPLGFCIEMLMSRRKKRVLASE